jgi:hypothetical protein
LIAVDIIHLLVAVTRSLYPFFDVIPYPQRVGHDGQSRIHRAAGNEKTAIDDIKIVHIVRFAVGIERARLRIIAKPNRADLVSNARQGNSLSHVEVSSE